MEEVDTVTTVFAPITLARPGKGRITVGNCIVRLEIRQGLHLDTLFLAAITLDKIHGNCHGIATVP